MQRFYFDFHDGDRHTQDAIGVLYADQEAAIGARRSRRCRRWCSSRVRQASVDRSSATCAMPQAAWSTGQNWLLRGKRMEFGARLVG